MTRAVVRYLIKINERNSKKRLRKIFQIFIFVTQIFLKPREIEWKNAMR